MAELAQVLRHVLPVEDPNALVSHATGDDAAVYRLSEDRALVVTTDFFSPIVDDPYDFGRIAAANALSDVYAMGARPLFALNLVAFPRRLLDEGILEEILRGGSDITRSAGIPTLGGHTIDDPEPKYGLVAIGEVDPSRMVTNAGGRPGDVLVLTKPLGTGVLATAVKAGAAPPSLLAEGVEIMATLNRTAAEAMVAAGASAATDVTGFGLLGHLRGLARASGLAAVVRAADVPLLGGIGALVEAGHVAGGTARNGRDLAADVSFGGTVDETTRTLLVDAQTSGGLLIAVAPERLEALLTGLLGDGGAAGAAGGPGAAGGAGAGRAAAATRPTRGRSPVAAVVGELVSGEPGRIQVV